MSDKDIFNLDDLSDVPRQVKSGLKILSRDDFEQKIIQLFKMANRPLSIDEVTVGYFRKFNEEKLRSNVGIKLYNMTRGTHGALSSVKDRKGIYELKFDKDVEEDDWDV